MLRSGLFPAFHQDGAAGNFNAPYPNARILPVTAPSLSADLHFKHKLSPFPGEFSQAPAGEAAPPVLGRAASVGDR